MAVRKGYLLVADTLDPESSDLAASVRRWLIIGGYILGGQGTLQTVLMFMNWGSPFYEFVSHRYLRPLYLLATICLLLSPPLLITGCWAFQHHKSWARTILLTYAGSWIAGLFANVVVRIVDMLSRPPSPLGWSWANVVSMVVYPFGYFIYSSVFAAALALCLMRPEIRDYFPESGRGFAPVFKDEGGLS
jgi:hypothetical protein